TGKHYELHQKKIDLSKQAISDLTRRISQAHESIGYLENTIQGNTKRYPQENTNSIPKRQSETNTYCRIRSAKTATVQKNTRNRSRTTNQEGYHSAAAPTVTVSKKTARNPTTFLSNYKSEKENQQRQMRKNQKKQNRTKTNQ